ncbi:hypothetical protein GCM10010503_40630 [Streptomyces lucensis JCM 4490]|uniref:Uncharacterized protein n=1 Tax=Streptomyces lucensis JCM 4490 TaxID=1306176 RepID=A0A918J8E2_9ACTN|nr:hypothetical protein GCM10010503_40630 [Streptomyces lucensis JCM 4490]
MTVDEQLLRGFETCRRPCRWGSWPNTSGRGIRTALRAQGRGVIAGGVSARAGVFRQSSATAVTAPPRADG